MATLKYQTLISSLPCDKDRFKEYENRDSYHWTYDNIHDSRNFKPVFFKDNREKKNCTGYGLSFYETAIQAKDRLLRIIKNKERSTLRLANCIAYGRLEKEDGISDEATSNGHFTHFEYEKTTLNHKFKVIDVVYEIEL